MQTVQIVFDKDLLAATDRAARRIQLNRSALVREALKEYLKKLMIRENERRDRVGYERIPDGSEEYPDWEPMR